MPNNKYLSARCAAIIGGVALLAASSANSQSLTIGTATVAAGTNASIPVTFTSGATGVTAISLTFSFARPPGVASGTATATAGSFVSPPGVTLSCGGSATTSATGTELTVQVFAGSALGNGTACTFTIPTAPGASGNNAFNITAAQFGDVNGDPLPPNAVTVTNGGINITGGGTAPPALGYSPAVTTTIAYPTGGAGPTINVTNAGGGAGSGAAATTTLTNCTISGGGAAFPTTNFNPNITAVGTGAPAPASFTLPACTPQAALQNATLTCVETRNGVAFAPAPTWPLTCPAAAGGGTAPTVTYAPVPTTTINFPAGAAGAATSSITVTSAGGTAPGSVTVNNCTATAGFTITNSPINLTGTAGAAQINGAINLQCTRGGAVQNGTLTCTETPTPGSAAQRSWPLVCPAATVAAVPPTLTYNPAPSVSAAPPGGPFTSIPYGSSSNINVLCASPSPDGTACGGSGSGDPATARLQNISVTYIGAPFSPTPANLSCVFANQANGTVPSPLNFVATLADPGNIRCTCANNPTASDNYRVSVQEVSPVGAAAVTRNFDITCGGAGVVCGTLTATPASGNISLNNGGAAVQVTALQAAGITAPNTRSVTCAVSGATAGSTFTVSPPSPISVGATAVNVTASCTNSTTTPGTATLTCTAAANQPLQGCAALTATYTLTCPGGNVPPPAVPSVPVPVMSDLGRIMLASLVLMLGLVAVGFRLRN